MTDNRDIPLLRQSVLEKLTFSEVLRSLGLALVSRARAPFARRSAIASAPVAAFYQSARGQEEKYEIVDLSRGSYRRLLDDLDQFAPIFLTSTAKILDLGSGDLHLLHHLERHGALPEAYWGVDILAPSKMARRLVNSKYGFETLDLQEANFSPPFKPNLVFSSNTLCYLRSPDIVLARAVSLLEAGGFLVIIEPLPSLFWENYFSGIHLNLRPRGALRPAIERMGVTFVGDHLLYAFYIAGQHLWPVACLSIFRR